MYGRISHTVQPLGSKVWFYSYNVIQLAQLFQKVFLKISALVTWVLLKCGTTHQ